jgi:hypothetical protein
MTFDGAEDFDCTAAWETSSPFTFLKAALYTGVFSSGEFEPENPYEEYFNIVTTRLLTKSAMETNRKIDVRYKWEPLDESIVTYSFSGYVLYIDAGINDEHLGFILRDNEKDVIAAFEYRKIFWISEVRN